jgi:hypothetical protein
MKKLIILIITIYCCNTHGQNNVSPTIQASIVSTWINEDDPNWKIVFASNGICSWYYTNQLTDTFNYSISISSPQCGYNVKINTGEDYYLRLVDQADSSRLCYEILGVDEESLSLSVIGEINKYHYFLKQ